VAETPEVSAEGISGILLFPMLLRSTNRKKYGIDHRFSIVENRQLPAARPCNARFGIWVRSTTSSKWCGGGR
jgi:hypothetical protein